jgi:hypothetical protein
MKKLILACLGIGISLIASAQFRPTFVYDDGNIPSGYFYSSAGFGGVYWSNGFGTAASGTVNYTPYNVYRPGYGTIVSMNTADSTKVTFPAKKCLQGPGSNINISAGLFKPFLVTFGNVNNDTTNPYTVDISSSPYLTITYSKPATPASDYYTSGQIVPSGGVVTSTTPSYLYNLGQLPSTVTAPGALTSGQYTNYNNLLGNLPSGITVPGVNGTNSNYVGNIYGLKSQGCCSPNINDSPLRVSLQVVDAFGTRLELALDGYNSASFTNAKLGYTMSTDAENNRSITLNLARSLVLNYTSTLPGTPNTCLQSTSCPSLSGGSTTTGLATTAGFRFDKVAKVLIFFSGRCAGNAANLSTLSTVGVCNYGPPNFTCYDNTVTITSFSLGAVPAPATPPRLDTVKYVSSSVVGIYFKNRAVNADSIIIARSVTSSGGWAIVGKTIPTFEDPNLPSTPNQSVSDYFGIVTTSGVFVSVSGVSFTTSGVYYYKLGVSYNGLITWGDTIRGTNGFLSGVGIKPAGIIDELINSTSIHLAPNPTTGITSLQYTLTKPASVSFKVYNSVGSEVQSHAAGNLIPGTYSDPINLVEYSRGLYFVVINVNGKPIATQKLLLD